MAGKAKLNPGLREHLPEIVELVRELGPPKVAAYQVVADKLGVTASLIQHYTLQENKRRRESRAETEPVVSPSGGDGETVTGDFSEAGGGGHDPQAWASVPGGGTTERG